MSNSDFTFQEDCSFFWYFQQGAKEILEGDATGKVISIKSLMFRLVN